MPAIELSARPQKAVLWPPDAPDASGEPTFGTRRELLVRWESRQGEVRRPDGSSVATEADVTLGEAVAAGSLMWLGAEGDIPGTAEFPDAGLHQVVGYEETPDLKGRATERTARLARFRDGRPGGG